jgi:signal transduction histidine kinase
MEFEARHRTKSGEIRDVMVRARPVQIGGTTCLLAVWHDITERKRAQEVLRESDRRKSEFLAMLSHELRNPLAPIRNSLYLLERAAPGSEQAIGARKVIGRQTQHLTRLVDDLLDVTRISRGKIELHRECADLREVVCHTCDDHRSMFEENQVGLSLVLPPRPIRADVDATRISQVLGNLLQNAAKFTPARGSVVVTVEMDEGRAIVRVRDSGVGMEPQLVERLFEPFVQAEHGLARTKGGLGLGLALVKGLVELHGGTVSARSEGVGHGSEFVVELPLAAGPPAEHPGARGAETTAGRSILVIEDNLDAARTLAAVMEMEGHRVHVATNGTTGIKMACDLKPDVVLCDIGLPDVNGYDVARELRGKESLRDTRLIAVTGYAQPEDWLRAAEAGFDAQLGKPASLEQLTALVSKVQ